MADYFVYLVAADYRSTLYTGVTNDLLRRAWQHRNGAVPGFTHEYGVDRLVWFEAFGDVHAAIRQEKRIKRWRRGWKYDLIERTNPSWADLYPALIEGTLTQWPRSSLTPREPHSPVTPDAEGDPGPGRPGNPASVPRDRPDPGSTFGRPG